MFRAFALITKKQSRQVDYYPQVGKVLLKRGRYQWLANCSLLHRIYIVVQENGFKLCICEYS